MLFDLGVSQIQSRVCHSLISSLPHHLFSRHFFQDVDEPWPIEVYAHDGKAYNVTMEVRAQYWTFVAFGLLAQCSHLLCIVLQHFSCSPAIWYCTRVTLYCTDDHSP